ncbi:MAG TPA: ferrous iron transport protein B [Atribacteraceae bacterium]|nr:ferrous iron transport protein B [Atribacteraceae bacterium]
MNSGSLAVHGKKLEKRQAKTVALIGNPNVGKTSVFNALTGSHQKVGNWPGVTVEKKEGRFAYAGQNINLVDLPGLYSLSPFSLDEQIARRFISRENPDAVVVIVDASNLERNMYLVFELIEMGVNLVMDLNFMDEAKERGLQVNSRELSQVLGIPVVETVAYRQEGIDTLKEAISQAAYNPRIPKKFSFPDRLENHVVHIETLIREAIPGNRKETSLCPECSACSGSTEFSINGFPVRWLATKLLENDPDIHDLIRTHLPDEKRDHFNKELANIFSAIRHDYQEEPEVVVAEERYAVIHGFVKEFFHQKATISRRMKLTDRLDRVSCHRYLGLPLFLVFMWLTFQATFLLGGFFVGYIEGAFEWLSEGAITLFGRLGWEWLGSLVGEGVLGGIGSILVFLPNIFILFLIISVLEDSGYLSRGAFVMDRLMHAIGLHGKSFIPMLLGFGCSVPGVLACRTLESDRDRKLTLLVVPLMSCTARLPIFILFTSLFFARNQGTVLFSLYLIGIVSAIFVAWILRKTLFKGDVSPLIMELPIYRIPSVKNVLGESWRKSALFLRKAGTIIFLVVIAVWLLASLPAGVEYASSESLMGRMGEFFAPLFRPLGFGFWQASVSLIFGTVAKEVVVGTLGALFGGEGYLGNALLRYFTPLSAFSFMVFSLLYIPCVATLGAIKREAGWKWTGFAFLYLFVLAYVLSLAVYQIGRLLVG